MQKVVFWNIFVLVLLALAFVFYNIGFPFLVGFIIAYFCLPICKKIEKLLKSRSASSAVLALIFFIAIILLIWVVIPIIKEDLYNAIKAISQDLDEGISSHLSKYYKYFPAQYAEHLKDEASKYIIDALSGAMTWILNIFSFNGVFMNVVSIILIAPFVIFFCLRDWSKIKRAVMSWIPTNQKTNFIGYANMVDDVMTKYILTQTKNISILALSYIIGLSFMGLRYSIVIGFLSGILSIMPYAGCVLGLLLSAIVCVAQYGGIEYHMIFVCIIYLIGYVLEVYILAPRLGKELGLHTLWIFFAFLAGIQICGLFGLLISIPMAALINISVKYFLLRFKESKVYVDD